MRHYWVSLSGCQDRCRYCGTLRFDTTCPDCLQKDLDKEAEWRDGIEKTSDISEVFSQEDTAMSTSRGNANNRRRPEGCLSQTEYAASVSTPERPVSRQLVQDWIARGKVQCVQDARGRRWVQVATEAE